MTTLLLIRHGQSCGNRDKRFIGHTDLPLSELGFAQARRTAEYVTSNYQVDKVYASDLVRAYETGKAVADRLGLTVIPEPDVREINLGIWENVSFTEMYDKGEKPFLVWKENMGRTEWPGGESVAEVQERASRALERIAMENDGKTVVVAAHAATIRAVQCLYEGKTLDEIGEIPWVSNASVTVFRYENGEMTVVSAGYDEHLQALRVE